MHFQNFQKQGPRSRVDFPAQAAPWGLQKYWLCQFYAWARSLALERKASLHGSPLERELTRLSGHSSLQKYWKHEIHARADIKILENPERVLELQFGILSNISCMQ